MTVTLNPKQSFLKLPEAKAFKEFSSTEAFEKALVYGLQYYSDQCTSSMHPNAAAMIHGARQFAQCLLNLTTPAEVPTKSAGQQLNYKA